MCIQRVGGNCHQICNFFFLFKLSTLPSHFGLFLFLFFSSVNINKYKQSLLLRSSIWESIAAASDLFFVFTFLLYITVFCLLCFSLIQLFFVYFVLFSFWFDFFQAHTRPGCCFWRSSSSNCPTAASTSRYKHRNLSRSFSGGEGGGVSDEDPMVPVDPMVTP